MGHVIGREVELAQVERFVAGSGALKSLTIVGAPGIGKTTLFRAGLDAASAAGRLVLRATATSTETQLSLAVLADLLEGVDPRYFEALPDVQKRAIDAALLHADPTMDAGWRPLAVAFLNVLRGLAREGDVLVAIDDLQWVDASSAQVLGFAARRLDEAPVRFLFAKRTEVVRLDPASSGAAAGTVEVGPLDIDDLGRVLRGIGGLPLSRLQLSRVHEATCGNPFYALEVARHIGRRPQQAGKPLPVPPSLSRLLQERLEDLSDEALEVLLVAALSAHPTTTLVDRVVGDQAAARRGRKEAVTAGVIEVGDDDIVSFSHPLYAACVHSEALPEDRRPLHGRLAILSEDEEERARHAALASPEPDEEVAGRLEAAAEAAARRGAPAAAADLYALAIDATDPGAIARHEGRQVERARCLALAGDSSGSMEDLRRLIANGSTPDVRLAALIELLEAFDDPNAIATVDSMLSEVDDPSARAVLHQHAVYLKAMSGRGEEALVHGWKAVADAEESGRLDLQAECVAAVAFAEVLRGSVEADAHLERAKALALASDVEIPPRKHPVLIGGYRAHACDMLAEARAAFEEMRHQAERAGDLPGVIETDIHLAEIAFREGNWDEAERTATAVLATMEEIGEEFLSPGLYIASLMDAALGRVEEAIEKATRGRRESEEAGETLFRVMNAWVEGFALLSIGDHSGAYRVLAPLPPIARSSGNQDTGFLLYETDLIEAAALTGHIDEASEFIEDVAARAKTQRRDRGAMVAARGRAMLASQEGDHDAAIRFMDDCDTSAERVGGQPFDRARNLMLRGWVQRRAKMKAAARASLEEAELTFTKLGAPRWAERARAEQRRIGGRTTSVDELTPSEEAIASLVATGASNREVADRLYISIKTVEANLSRIYRKLNVRSRSELAASYQRIG